MYASVVFVHSLIGRDVKHSRALRHTIQRDTLRTHKCIQFVYMCNIVHVERLIPGALYTARIAY